MKGGRRVFVVSVGLICVLLFVGAVLCNSVQQQRNEQVYYEEVGSDTSIRERDFWVEVDTGQGWLDDLSHQVGAQYDGYFNNERDVPISDWTIVLTVPENTRIDSSWNGVFVKEGNTITITAVDYNTEIKCNESAPFGMVLYADELLQIDDIIVSGYYDYRVEDFVEFRILAAFMAAILLFDVVYFIVYLRVRKEERKESQYKEIIEQSLHTFANIIDTKDPYTHGHSERVAEYSREIARRIGKSAEEQEHIYQIALLHDIGKIGISDTIINKPGSLTEEERSNIQRHTTIGGEVLKDFTAIAGIDNGARFHHEWVNGEGYPMGLKGNEIPECARIICVADSFDAMDSDRCYRSRLDRRIIIDELRRCSGKQFEPAFAECMIEIIEEKLHQAN